MAFSAAGPQPHHDPGSGPLRPGRAVFSTDEWQQIAKRLELSDRELQVVKCVFDGDSERAMARRLKLSAHTIHTYVWRVYRKLGVYKRGEMMVRVFSESRIQTD